MTDVPEQALWVRVFHQGRWVPARLVKRGLCVELKDGLRVWVHENDAQGIDGAAVLTENKGNAAVVRLQRQVDAAAKAVAVLCEAMDFARRQLLDMSQRDYASRLASDIAHLNADDTPA